MWTLELLSLMPSRSAVHQIVSRLKSVQLMRMVLMLVQLDFAPRT